MGSVAGGWRGPAICVLAVVVPDVERSLRQSAATAYALRQLFYVRRQADEDPVPEAAAGGSVGIVGGDHELLVCAGKPDQCSSGEMFLPPMLGWANLGSIGWPSSTSLLASVNALTFGRTRTGPAGWDGQAT